MQVEIEIPSLFCAALKHAFEKMKRTRGSFVGTHPKIRNGNLILEIGSTLNFFRYIDQVELTQFDQYRLKQLIVNALDSKIADLDDGLAKTGLQSVRDTVNKIDPRTFGSEKPVCDGDQDFSPLL